MAPPARPPKDKRAQEKSRLDVSTPPPALKHNPFAVLVGADPPPGEPPPGLPAKPAGRPSPAPAAKPLGRLILRRETKHRGGKTVVIVAGFAQLPGITDRALEELLQELKQRLGCGGSVTARELLLQGDRPAQVAALLRDRGYRVDGVTS